MKKIMTVLLLCTLSFAMLPAPAQAETTGQNRMLEALQEAADLAAEASAKLNAFLNADAEAVTEAEKRGNELSDTIRSAVRDLTVVLEGDTSLAYADALAGGTNRSFTIDLNGYVLYAPSFSYGNFRLKNGVAADLSGENESSPLRLTIENDVTVLRHMNQYAIDLSVTGDLTLNNYGVVNGIRRILYQNAPSNRITIVNEGTVYSDLYALSLRAFHQSSTINLTQNGVLAGLIRGLDIHAAGGNMNAEGKGTVYGAMGPDLEIPKLVFRLNVVADDWMLSNEQIQYITDKVNPYGEKDIPTGIAFDLQQSKADYWNNWTLTPKVWASRKILRFALPQNQKMKGQFNPEIDEDSPSRDAECLILSEQAYHSLTGSIVERRLTELWSSFNMENYFSKGGNLEIRALSRYAEKDGKMHVLFSVADTPWSRIGGKRTGKEYSWKEAENGTVEPQMPVSSLDDFYQLKAALNTAGAGGVVKMDMDADIQSAEESIPLPENVSILGQGKLLSGTPVFSVNKQAAISGLNLTGQTLTLKKKNKTGDRAVIDCGEIDTLISENVSVLSDGSANTLRLNLGSGNSEYRIQVIRDLIIDTTENSGASAVISGQIGENILILMMQGRNGKRITLEGTTKADAIRIRIQNASYPDQVLGCDGSDPLRVYGNYLKTIFPRGLTGQDGEIPKAVILNQDNETAFSFRFVNNSWVPENG